MRWIVKLVVFPIWLAVMLLGIVRGVVAAIGQRWTDVAIFACCEAAIFLLQVAAVGIELLLETASERLGRVIA